MAGLKEGRRLSGIDIKLEDKSLLRATSLVTVLRGYGAHLKSANVAVEEADKAFARSQEVDRIMHFLSHAWKDSRHEKWLTLCMHFNLVGAILVPSLVVVLVKVIVTWAAFPTATLAVCGKSEVEYAPWCLIAGTVSYYVCLHYWHHMPHCLLGSRQVTVFLDKLCVHQTDAERKQAGILAFASFIANSNRVLCLWSPEYFNRLWCTLEMAAWVSSQQSGFKPLVFLPLRLYKLTYVVNVFFSVARMAYAINNATGRIIPAALMMGLWCFVAPLVLTYSLRQYLIDRAELENQLQAFSVQSAACADEEDRAVVYQALRSWFGDLSDFDNLVRTQVRAHIVANIGSSAHVPFVLTVPTMLHHLFFTVDYVMGGCYGFNAQDFTPIALLQDLAWILCVGATLPQQMWLLTCVSVVRPRRWIVDWAVTFIGGVIVAIQFAVIFVLLGNTSSAQPIWPIALVTFGCAVWFLWLQRESFFCRTAPAQSARQLKVASSPLPPIVSV